MSEISNNGISDALWPCPKIKKTGGHAPSDTTIFLEGEDSEDKWGNAFHLKVGGILHYYDQNNLNKMEGMRITHIPNRYSVEVKRDIYGTQAMHIQNGDSPIYMGESYSSLTDFYYTTGTGYDHRKASINKHTEHGDRSRVKISPGDFDLK